MGCISFTREDFHIFLRIIRAERVVFFINRPCMEFLHLVYFFGLVMTNG